MYNRNLTFRQAVARVIVIPLMAASLMFGCKKAEPDRLEPDRLDYPTLLRLRDDASKRCKAIISNGSINRDLNSWNSKIVGNIDMVYLTPKITTEGITKYSLDLPQEIVYAAYHISLMEGFSWLHNNKWAINVFFSSAENDSITVHHEVSHYVWIELPQKDRDLIATLIEHHGADRLKNTQFFVKHIYIDKRFENMKKDLKRWREQILPYAIGEVKKDPEFDFFPELKIFNREFYSDLISKIDKLLGLCDSVIEDTEIMSIKERLNQFRTTAKSLVPRLKTFCKNQFLCKESGLTSIDAIASDFYGLYIGELFARLVEAHFGNHDIPKLDDIEDTLVKIRFRKRPLFSSSVQPHVKYPKLECAIDLFYGNPNRTSR